MHYIKKDFSPICITIDIAKNKWEDVIIESRQYGITAGKFPEGEYRHRLPFEVG